MEFVRLGAYGVGFVCRMQPNGCEGTVTVAYGGRFCGTVTVRNPNKDYVGTVSGPGMLTQGESVIYYHDLGPGCSYTGTLPGSAFSNDLGNGVICTAPANAPDGTSHTVSFTGPCNSRASKTVIVAEACDFGTACSEGTFPGVGGYVNYSNHVYRLAASFVEGYTEEIIPAGEWECIGDSHVRYWRGQKVVEGILKSYADHHPMELVC
jgi:hypothetical protein